MWRAGISVSKPQVIQRSAASIFCLICFRILFLFKEMQLDFTPQFLFLHLNPIDVTNYPESFIISIKISTFLVCVSTKK